MPDETITCCDCGNTFTFSQGEQDYYAKQGFNRPKRCRPCREEKKKRVAAKGGASK